MDPAATDISLMAMFAKADPVVKGVMLMLALASLWSWAVAIDKWLQFGDLNGRARQFEKLFWSGQSLETLDDSVADRPRDSLARVFSAEVDAIAAVRSGIVKGTIVHADESTAWNPLHASFTMRRINHQDGYSIGGACTNGAESYFSRLRRGELGHHHHIAGPYLVRYAQEAAWREDLRRVSNGEQVHGVAGLAMRCRPSVDFCGYWQRARAA